MKNKLTKEELRQIKGGKQKTLTEQQDVNNNNSFSSCLCEYNNNSVIGNNNEVMGCTCTCT